MKFSVIPQEYIDAYSKYLSAMDRGGGQNMTYLSVFDSYCSKNWPGKTQLTQEMVDKWCAQRPTEKNNSTRSRIFPIVEFIHYLRERGLADLEDPEIPKATPRNYIPYSFGNAELSKFFKACDSYEVHLKRKKDKNLKLTIPVFFRLLYSSGIRTTEARLLRRTDADLDTGVLNIRKSKGHSQHFVVLHDSILPLMCWYDSAMENLYPGREYFFPVDNDKGRSMVWVWKTFSKIWGQISENHATAYDLRHNYAIENINRWTELGFDFFDKLVYLSKSMGHSTIENTKYYYSLVPSMSSLLRDKTEADFDDIIPEVDYEESE